MVVCAFSSNSCILAAHNLLLCAPQAHLQDFRRGIFPTYDKKGRIDVDSAGFDITFRGTKFHLVYSKGEGRVEFIQETTQKILQKYGEDNGLGAEEIKGLDCEDEVADMLTKALAPAFQAKRQGIQDLVSKLRGKHDMDLVDKITVAKIYPSNIIQALTIIEKEKLAAKHSDMKPIIFGTPTEAQKDDARKALEERKEADRKESQEKLAKWTYKPGFKAIYYGPIDVPEGDKGYLDQQHIFPTPPHPRETKPEHYGHLFAPKASG